MEKAQAYGNRNKKIRYKKYVSVVLIIPKIINLIKYKLPDFFYQRIRLFVNFVKNTP